jgi:tRNA(Ile)-lysidine synthase
MGIQSQVRITVGKYRLSTAGDRVVVGVSGGPDSIALLHLLLDLRRELGLHLEVAHVMHGIRGEEAEQDARFVADLANELGLSFHLKKIDVPKEKAQRGKGNIEAIGRQKRYDFFASVMRETNCNKVATGHTRDDQVETMLMWLFRGGGRGSLSGIPPLRSLENGSQGRNRWVVRPLIETSKEEILSYLKKRKILYRQDQTNLDPTYLRNWIRLHLLPELRHRIDPRLDLRLARLCELFWDEEKLLEGLAATRLQAVVRNATLDVESFRREEKALQRRLLRLWLKDGGGAGQGLTFDHIEGCRRLIAEGPAQGRVSLPRGLEVAREYNLVGVQRKKIGRSHHTFYHYTLSLDETLLIPEAGVRIRTSVQACPPTPRARDNTVAVFDLEAIFPALTVRNFRAGDRIQPLGMNGRKKVKDLFIDLKVPTRVRQEWPFLLSGEQILWIPGYARSDLAKIGPTTSKVLRVAVRSVVRQR